MKEAKEARVCILKNRSGQTTAEPVISYVDPVFYYIGSEVTGMSSGESSPEAFSDLLSSNSDLFIS